MNPLIAKRSLDVALGVKSLHSLHSAAEFIGSRTDFVTIFLAAIFVVGAVATVGLRRSYKSGKRKLSVNETESLGRDKPVEYCIPNSESWYQFLFLQNPHPMWIADARTHAFLEANAAAVQRYGYNREEFLRMTIDDLHPAGDHQPLSEMLAKCSHGDRFSGTYCHLTKNGRTLHVDISGSIFEQHGRLLSLAVAIDVSEKRRAEEELRASEERYRALFDDNLAAMFHAQAGRLLHCNEAMCRMLGYTRSEMKELDLSLLHCDPAAREAARTTLYEKGHLHNHEAELWRKDGSKITVLANLDLVRRGVGEPQIIAGVMLDVTEIRKLQEQLQHSQKMEAIGQLTGGIAHDFNNVLMIINCYCEILSERLTRDNPLYGPVEQIRAAGLRATSLTGQLLAFSRKQVLTPVVMDLAETVTGLKEILKRLIGEDIQLETALTEDICSVTADPNQIEQVLLNLAINARDAMPNGGKLSIGTTVTQLDQEFVRAHPGSKAGEFVVLKVSDTGAGIPFEMQSRVFEPFFTTKEAGKGTGLGLSTVYGIVKQSDGYIRLDSEPGKGATFTIYLPRVHESCEAPPPQSVPATNNLKLTVLLVEDEDPTREALAAYLQQNGCAVLSAANGQRALDICKSIQPNVIDVLLTDVVMPGINGIELSKRLHADFPNLKTLFMSGYTDDVLIRSGMRHSEVVLLPKPFSLPSLLNKLNSLCATAR